jgi:hypothetical protein
MSFHGLARKHGKSREALARVQSTDFSKERYRGYWIKTNALTGGMWIEKDGFLIAWVPSGKSWDHARAMIDELCQE